MFLRFVRLQWTGNSWSENKIKIEPIHVQQMGGKQHRPRILSKCHETVFYQERTNRSGRQEDEGGKGRKKCRQSLVWQIINSATPCLSQEGTCSCNPKTNLSRLSAYLLLCHPIQHTSSLPLPLCVHPKFKSPLPSYRPGATKKTTDKLSFTFFWFHFISNREQVCSRPPQGPSLCTFETYLHSPGAGVSHSNHMRQQHWAHGNTASSGGGSEDDLNDVIRGDMAATPYFNICTYNAIKILFLLFI